MFELCNRCEFWFYLLFPINAMLYNYKKWLGITFTLLLTMATWVQNFYSSYSFHSTPQSRVFKVAICYNVTMLKFYKVIMLQCYKIIMLQCYNF